MEPPAEEGVTMGEVTVEADEVVKQEFPFEQLPEPLLIILSPPPAFLPAPGEPVMLWHKWLKAFEVYMDQIGEKDLSDSSKCLLLQNCLGAEGQRVFRTLAPSGGSYAAVVSTLTLYFTSDHASQTYRLKFHHRTQMPGETVAQFVAALEELLRPCDYGEFRDQLILDQLIQNTNCPQLKERLLLEGESLTLDKALVVGKDLEAALGESELFGVHEVSVDIGEDLDPPVQRKARRGRPRRGERRAKAPTKPRVNKTPRRAPRCKDERSVRKEPRYRDDRDDEDELKNADESPPAHDDDDDDDDEAALSSQGREEGGDKDFDIISASAAADDDDDNTDDTEDEDEDEEFLISSTNQKGPCCPFCVDRRFSDAHKLARHMRTHTKEKPFSCPVCTLTFSQSYHMTRHMRNKHDAGPHVCSTCGESLGSVGELREHKKTHASQVLTCPDCCQVFADSGAFFSHVLIHGKKHRTAGRSSHRSDETTSRELAERCIEEYSESDDDDGENEEQSGDSQVKVAKVRVKTEDVDADEATAQKDDGAAPTKKGYSCPICVDRHFRGQNKLERHMRTHTKEKPFSCPICSLTFSQSYHMTRHLRNQHDVGQHICSKCGESLSSMLELRTHKKTHVVEGLTCFACQKQFKEKSALVSHLKVHKKVQSSSSRSLTCNDCGKEFGRLYHLKRHIVTHRKGSNSECYTCPDCHKDFAFPEDLNKHLEIHVKENNGMCPKCDETFDTTDDLETHMKVHDKSYPCDVCGKKFKVEYALKKHVLGHQGEQYYCSLCRKHFIKLSHYKRHVMVHDRRESRCPHCDSVFLKLTALKYHLRTHVEERPHQCSCCIETFEEKEDLEQHCLKHRKFKRERPYSCTRCDHAFCTLVELTEHMGAHEGEQPSSCPVCGRTFLNKNKLEKHLTIHTGERPHLCSICGNGFPSAASLKLHTHIHTGEKPYQCSQCSKSFRSSSGLRLHGRQHMEVRPSYECPQCGRTYGRMTELKMHQRYHTGDKPFACTCCNKRFISKDKLNVHMRIHTGERPYSCSHCGQTFTQTGDRNRHISKFHPSESTVNELQ
ncbi:zinc finger protein 585A-like [Antennarius striatus]|uniref:zinc finger protein 585A-like n=1 Tax=Antennarius striatus TaxID=241820 RepID=UPI0035B1A6D5